MTCETSLNKSDLMLQVIALNKAILKLNIEQLENEILSFEDILQNTSDNPENKNISFLLTIKEKFTRLHQLKQKLASLELNN